MAAASYGLIDWLLVGIDGSCMYVFGVKVRGGGLKVVLMLLKHSNWARFESCFEKEVLRSGLFLFAYFRG